MIKVAILSPQRLRGIYSYSTIDELPFNLSEHEKKFMNEYGWLRIGKKGKGFAAYDDQRDLLVCPLGGVGLVMGEDFLSPERQILKKEGI